MYNSLINGHILDAVVTVCACVDLELNAEEECGIAWETRENFVIMPILSGLEDPHSRLRTR